MLRVQHSSPTGSGALSSTASVLRGTNLSNEGRAASFSRVCRGDFSNASLFGAVLVDAAVATESGEFPVTVDLGA